MTVVYDPVALIQKNFDDWGSPYPELDIFATERAEEIVHLFDAFCHEHLGGRLAGSLFYGSSIGSTLGARLEDGRLVVIKARPPATANPDLKHDGDSLGIICRVMAWLHAGGYPCPEVLLGPTPLGNGLATVEAYRPGGERGDGFRPGCRRIIAQGLADLIVRLRDFPGEVARLQPVPSGSRLFPQPHSKIFDFERTTAGAEWIDDFARRARRVERHPEGPVLGHGDWRVEHLRFRDETIVATYDWDSLATRPETALVGMAAHGFTADWSLPGVRRIPGGDDIRAFVADYERARGRSFAKAERRAVFSSCLYSIAYGARCAHALHPDTTEWAPDSWPYLLRTEGEALLADATD